MTTSKVLDSLLVAKLYNNSRYWSLVTIRSTYPAELQHRLIFISIFEIIILQISGLQKNTFLPSLMSMVDGEVTIYYVFGMRLFMFVIICRIWNTKLSVMVTVLVIAASL